MIVVPSSKKKKAPQRYTEKKIQIFVDLIYISANQLAFILIFA